MRRGVHSLAPAIGENEGNEDVEVQSGFREDFLCVGTKPDYGALYEWYKFVCSDFFDEQRLLDETVDEVETGEAVLASPLPVDADKIARLVSSPVPRGKIPVDAGAADHLAGEGDASRFVEEWQKVTNETVFGCALPDIRFPSMQEWNRIDTLRGGLKIRHGKPDGVIFPFQRTDGRNAGRSFAQQQCLVFGQKRCGIAGMRCL